MRCRCRTPSPCSSSSPSECCSIRCVLVREPLKVLAVVFIVMIGKSLAALAIVLAFRHPLHTALTDLGRASRRSASSPSSWRRSASPSDCCRPKAQSLIVAGALLSITLNPADVRRDLRRRVAPEKRPIASDRGLRAPDGSARAHRAHRTRPRRRPGRRRARRPRPAYVVVEADLESAAALLKQGIPVVYGDAARPGVLEHAGVDARLLVVTAPDAFQARAAIELARRVQPEIDIVVRTHSDSERTYLEGKNVGKAVMGEHELAEAMARYALERLGRRPPS